MKLLTYWKGLNPSEKKAFVAKAETTMIYMSQLANGHRNAGLELAIKIQSASERQVTVEELAGMSE